MYYLKYVYSFNYAVWHNQRILFSLRTPISKLYPFYLPFGASILYHFQTVTMQPLKKRWKIVSKICISLRYKSEKVLDHQD